MTRKIGVICATPRPFGVSRTYADLLVEQLSKLNDVEIIRWDMCQHKVMGCIGCERCREAYTCIIHDDMDSFDELIDTCDELHLVCPVYYAAVPSQFKGVLDRLQPYWERRIGPNKLAEPATGRRAKRSDSEIRPVELYVIGAGGDPYGFEPLVVSVKSALGSAGFKLGEVHDLVGWGQQQKEAFRA